MTTIISAVILLTYITWFCIKHGIPTSLSDTYYYLEYNIIFTLTIWICGFLVLPGCMDQAKDAPTQIIPFLGVAGLILVGTAPRVRDCERTIHLCGAIMSGVFSQLWTLMYGNPWLLLLWIFPGIIWIARRITKRDLCFVFWSEMVCFITLYTSLLI